MNDEKLSFLKVDLFAHLRDLDESTPAQWGKMNVRQMIEHLADVARVASGHIDLPILNEGETLEKARAFMLSEKPFRPETRSPMLGEEPYPLRFESKAAALAELERQLAFFHKAYAEDAERTIVNPVFGSLNYAEHVHLLHKHVTHHLRQFGVNV